MSVKNPIYRPRIGVDIDGVIADTYTIIAEVLKRELGIPIDKNDIIKYDLRSLLGGKFFAEIENIFRNNEEYIYKHVKPVEEASIHLNKISRYYKIVYVTARSERYRNITERWLLEHYFPTSQIMFATEKIKILKQFNIPLMIEDSPYNISDMALAGIRVIIFDRPYNKDIDIFGTKRVTSWKQITVDFIRKLVG